MSETTATTGSSVGGTTATDYSEHYYRHYSDSEEPYAWSSPGWRAFFTGVAARVIAATGPVGSVLDVGCAKGLLVQGFLVAGSTDAEGFDLSETAIAEADPEVRDRVRVASATVPFGRRYDLVTCIEVLEHLSPPDAATTIENICAATDRVVLSSTPGDFDEPTHVNVHPVADWAAEFAARGFYRRTDVDLSFLSPWAVYVEKAPLRTRDVVHRYEAAMYPLRQEVAVKRDTLLDMHRQLGELEDGAVVADLRHQLLILRDHAIGAEATVGTARAELARVAAENGALKQEVHQLLDTLREYADELEAVRASLRWRVGGTLMSPMAAVKRQVRR
ncbi:class I SAM-dependent methyltransferase [Lapillicoccus sp.]|uniref:class I SAM-dependent methyltransferase n=1 Tax=Lapillicoccus sp. TaxID=1909287 RepID=UPI0025DF1131|nr:class I SAM-dependent methyltransferase [Lapillicoccus sp.]